MSNRFFISLNRLFLSFLFIWLCLELYHSLLILGGINLYITGVTILASIVELISPPINTIANGAISGLGFQARGINPQMAVIDVRTTGKKRVSPAILIASSMLCPLARNWLVKSTSNSEFLTCIPDKPMNPIMETNDMG